MSGSMHYRPLPRGYRPKPIIPKKVKVSTITKSINSGNYHVIVFYTDTKRVMDASIVRTVEGEDAISLALQLLNEWANYEGKVEKCLLSTGKHFLHKDLWKYRNVYSKLNTNPHELVVLIKK